MSAKGHRWAKPQADFEDRIAEVQADFECRLATYEAECADYRQPLLKGKRFPASIDIGGGKEMFIGFYDTQSEAIAAIREAQARLKR